MIKIVEVILHLLGITAFSLIMYGIDPSLSYIYNFSSQEEWLLTFIIIVVLYISVFFILKIRDRK